MSLIDKLEKERRQSLRNSLPSAELILWSRLKNRQICAQKFRRQFSVGPYVVDFYCPALKLAIEIDGDSHFQPGEQEKDRTRQQFIESTGVQFLRLRNIEVRQNLRGRAGGDLPEDSVTERNSVTPCRRKSAASPLPRGTKNLATLHLRPVSTTL